MSETTLAARPETGADVSRAPARKAAPRLAVVVLCALLLCAVPLYLEGSWLVIGVLGMATAVGAIGLTLLVGTAGQLSLAHSFFVAVGAYAYAYLAGVPGTSDAQGLGLPSWFAALAAVALAGLAGLAFSPVAARVKGLYLGVASLALVFVGEHVLKNAVPLTGGYNGREVTPLSVFGFELTGDAPDLWVLGVPFGGQERLWYVALAVLAVSVVAAGRIVRGRPGRALQTLRDNPAAAGSMGVSVRAHKAAAFTVSSVFAGAAGVLTALAFGFIVPHYFSLHLAVLYLAMALIGGLGSVPGAVAGGLFVTALPLLLERFSGELGFLAAPGSGGLDAAMFARFVFGALLVLILIAEPGGLAGLWRRLRRTRR
ncbi:branched-chain amino acid ABC transporter permease [Actinocorallia sp. A-T 12471]|uniref:branched-chain amino acid ABC transporter permease n=1 Tax=Actinocorallia sp. A-T 12471 TaxID=3089813 RepID=UPI0029CEA78A|nr:branched-chain amino acid ABC transporter permease [Actinocorallia sp. A-T 12471]MDX6744229.1 branched-chain amino acid ABC transporter permease [Actinocorallia sp. A-T 12471]